jgi:PadR family transcriptional regulator, regulatory protein AphA
MVDYRVISQGNQKFIECIPGMSRIENEQDALDLVAACGENETNLLLLHADNLTDDFFHLKTGLAGKILLKFSNYFLKVAAVLTPDLVNQGKFKDMAIESNRSQEFRIFYDLEVAKNWLLKS